MNNPRLLAFITLCIWSFGTYVARLISMKSQFVLLSLSFFFSFLSLLLFFLLTRRGGGQKPSLRLRKRYFLFGPFGYFVYSVGLNQSLRAFNSASEATILNYTWPLFTIIFTLLIFQRQAGRSLLFRVMQGAGIALGFLAVLVLATEGRLSSLDLSNLEGIAWGLLAGASYGLFSAFSSTVPRDQNTVFLLVSTFTSLLLMLVLSVSEIAIISTLGTMDLIVAFASGAVLNGVGYVTWTRANRLAHELHIDISAVASMMFALPLLSLTVIALLLGESSLGRPFFLVSLLLLVLSSLLCQRTDQLVQWLQPSRKS